MMLYFARGLHFYTANQRRGEWVRDVSYARLLKDRTAVILGLGDIGREVARRARAFGMRIIGVKRTLRPVEEADRVVTSEQLDDVLPLADHLAVTLPLTRETYHLLDARRLSLLPRGAFVYNIGRGAVVDEQALIEALRSGHIAGAGLDVFEDEPLPPESPLWRMDNVLITPHVGADTPWDYDAAGGGFLGQLLPVCAGRAAAQRSRSGLRLLAGCRFRVEPGYPVASRRGVTVAGSPPYCRNSRSLKYYGRSFFPDWQISLICEPARTPTIGGTCT